MANEMLVEILDREAGVALAIKPFDLGATTVSLDLIRQGGQMKIERESGVPLLRSG